MDKTRRCTPGGRTLLRRGVATLVQGATVNLLVRLSSMEGRRQGSQASEGGDAEVARWRSWGVDEPSTHPVGALPGAERRPTRGTSASNSDKLGWRLVNPRCRDWGPIRARRKREKKNWGTIYEI